MQKYANWFDSSEKLSPKELIGLYRDDGLAITNLPGPDMDRLRKEVTNPPIYIQRASNHPPDIIKQLPSMIGRCITSISINKEVFDAEALIYNFALRHSGFTEEIQYTEDSNSQSKRPQGGNAAARLLQLIDKH